jgi:tRNA (cmo5U34)-methyltransferase
MIGKDSILPSGPWQFDSNVTKVFDDMLARSIPSYIEMRDLTTQLACRYAVDQTAIIDLGCSRGGSLAPIIEKRGNLNQYIGVEVSQAMREACLSRFSDLNGIDIQVLDLDLRTDFPKTPSSVVLSVLTLQFIPIEYRQEILSKAYDSLIPGGIFVLVEKILGADAHSNGTLVDLYYSMKGKNGYTEEQINTKRKSLEGVLVPVTADWNVQLLESAGFKHVDAFWRNLNFAGWMAVKGN